MTATATNGNGQAPEVPAMRGAVDLSQYVPEEVDVPAAEPDREDLEPTGDYAEAVKRFRRPFGWNAVKFRALVSLDVGNQHQGSALVAAYIDARLVIERLNLVVGGAWSEEYRPTAANVMWCDLTVLGVKHTDVGEDYTSAKALVSDALKRAAVKHGIGVSLYAVPKMWLSHGPHLIAKTGGKEPYYDLSDEGERYVRQVYAGWLQQEGQRHFGKVLSHGDGIGSVGDALDGALIGSQPAAPAAAPAQPAIDPVYEDCFAEARAWVGERLGDIEEGDDEETIVEKKGYAYRVAQLRMKLVMAGVERDVTQVREAINSLTPDQARGLLKALKDLNQNGGRS